MPLICRDGLFVHVERTGGTSIRSVLLATGDATLVCSHSGRYNPHLAPDVLQAVLGEKFASLWVFGFVRNPWDQYVSLYSYFTAIRYEGYFGLSFEQFLKKRIGQGLTQQYFFREPGLYQYVGRFENLLDDWHLVARRLQVDQSLPHQNRSAHAHYSGYYTKDLVDLVGDTERYLVGVLGYTFQRSDAMME